MMSLASVGVRELTPHHFHLEGGVKKVKSCSRPRWLADSLRKVFPIEGRLTSPLLADAWLFNRIYYLNLQWPGAAIYLHFS